MCNTQILATSGTDYVIRCAGCGRMQICFGVTAIMLKQDQFLRLKVHIAEAVLYGENYKTEPDRRSVSLPVNKTMTLCLNRNELADLEDLVTQAAALMEVYELLTKE